MVLQRWRLVLRKDEDLTDVRVDTVVEGEVDQVKARPRANDGLRAVRSMGKEMRPFLAGQDTGHDVA
jgi:hypothetical protein